jgi:glycerol uptake facilitator-like aquaporin
MSSESLSAKTLSVEFLATLLLVFAGCGATVASGKSGNGDYSVLQDAVGWGLVYAVLTQSFAHISGAHMNPAVTIALFVSRRISFSTTLVYMATQS